MHSLLIPRNELKQCLTGALELACFLEQGIARFSNTAEEALRSYWVILASFSLNCSAMLLMRAENEKLGGLPPLETIYNDAVRIVFVNLCFALVLYGLCKWWGRLQDFPRLLSGLNWLQVMQILLLTPLHLMVWAGIHNIQESALFELLFIIYFICASSFYIGRTLKMPLAIAGYLMLMMFAIDYISLMVLLN